MLKRKHSRLSILSLLLSVAMLLSCLTVVMIPASAEGATYESDEAAVAAGYVFRLNGKYYKKLADAHLDVADGDVIEMLADYNNSGCEYVGWDATNKVYTATKTYTINANNKKFISTANHGLHFYRANVTVNDLTYIVNGDGNVSGFRVECTASVTLKNCTVEKTGSAANSWNTPVIVYGTLILDEGTVLKNNNEKSSANSHGLYLEGKGENGTNSTSIIPKLILKSNATIKAKQNAIYESTKSEIQVQSPDVSLTGTRKSASGTTVIMSGPSAAELEDPVVTEKWKALYTKMGQEWGTADIAQIGETKYSTLTAALRSATNGCTIQLLTNIALDSTLTFAPDTAVNFTLDGAGFTISGGNFTLLSLGENVTCTMKNVTFQNGNGGGTGTLDLAGADVTLDNGAKVTNSGSDRVNLGNSEWVGVSITKNSGKLTVNTGATIEVCGTAIKSDGYTSETVIDGGTVKTNNRGYITNNSTSSLMIKSGLFETTRPTDALILTYGASGATVKVYGGTLKTTGIDIVSGSASKVVIGGTFTVGTETYTVNTLDSYSLSLNDDIGINFYAALSDNETKLSATLPNGKVVAMRLSDANQKTAKFGLLNLYRFTVNVSAADMTAEIPVKLEAAGNTDDVTVSIVRYAKQILSDNAYSESAKALVTAMLHYGAAAQTFFEKNPDNLANKDLTAPDFSAITVAASYAPSVTGSAEGLTYFGSSLLLKGKTVIRHYFRLADGKSISDYQFKLGETVLTATQYKDTELYFVEITGIKSSDLTTAYTVTVGDLTVTYSAMSYAYTALTAEGVDDTLAATVKALVNYANAAKTYFAAN
jgi:cysteine protease